MLIYKQRYKPRTEREYTKNDLTVYDSAGNTALRGLKVYGKSEIVVGAIKSAGEGWSVVDLGTLNWSRNTNVEPFFYSDNITNIIKKTPNNQIAKLLIDKYTATSRDILINGTINNAIAINGNGTIQIRDTAYTDATAFKSAMSGVLLCYQLADPSQGNAIAIKTDNGTGINGTMATFSTGAPLYGVSDTIRDVMEWDGSAGTATKKCGEVDLGTLNYSYIGAQERFSTTDIASLVKAPATNNIKVNCLTSMYQVVTLSELLQTPYPNLVIGVNDTGNLSIRNTAYTDPATFKSAMNGVTLVYELATPSTEQLTQTENDSIASLRTFDRTTHFTNNAATDMTVNYTIKVPTI